MWIFNANEFTKQYVYINKDRIMDFESHTGRYSVWSMDRDPMTIDCRVLDDTVATGYLQSAVGHKVLFAGENLLDFNSASGKFKIASCDLAEMQSEGRLQCETWAEGTWPQFAGRTMFIVRQQPSVMLMDVNPDNGDYRVWQLGTKEMLDSGVPLLPSAPLGQGSSAGLIAADVTVVSSLSVLVAQQSVTSMTTFYELVGGSLSELGKPVKKGFQMVEVGGKKQLMQMKFASAGNNTLLQYGPLGFWQYLDCYPYPVYGDVFGTDSPIHCSVRSAGSPNPPMCSEKTSEEACTAHPSCGWCSMNLKCFTGYRGGVCSKSAPTCPSSAWKIVEGTFEPSGFVNGLKQLKQVQDENKAHDCSHSSNCRGCVSDLECGWHVASRKCVAGGPSGPADSSRYPVWSKTADWNYSYCGGIDACEHLKDCSDCTSASYCGWCSGSNRCVTSTATGPLFEACDAGFFFDRCEASTAAH